MGIGADDATPKKSEELHGGTGEEAPKYPLAAAGQLSCRNNALNAVATLEKRDQNKGRQTFKGSIDARKGESGITQFEHYVGLLQQDGQLSSELVHVTGEP